MARKRKTPVPEPAKSTVDPLLADPFPAASGKSATKDLAKIDKPRKKRVTAPAKSIVDPSPAGNARKKKVPAPATSIIDLDPLPEASGESATKEPDKIDKPRKKRVTAPAESTADPPPAGNTRKKKVLVPATSIIDLDPSPSASGKSKTKGRDKIDQLFFSYADNTSGVIGPEGIESLCSDLGVVHTDVRILMLAWKMQAEKQGYFTLYEWRKALKALKHATINQLTKSLVDLEEEVKMSSNFVDFYSYAFRYCLTEDMQKTVDIESICVLLDLVLGSKLRPQVDSFIQFLKLQTDYKVMSMDQWVGFHRFCNEISFPDLGNFDPYVAWPSLLDDFVDWIRLSIH